jgi:hypothetical protein
MNIHPVDIGGYYILACIFSLLYSIIYKTLKRSSLVHSQSAVMTVALTISMLCGVGIYGFVGNPATLLSDKPVSATDIPGHNRDFCIAFLIIPYAALGLSLLAMPLLKSVDRLFQPPRKDGTNYQPKQNTLHDKSNQQPDYFRQLENDSSHGLAEEDFRDDDDLPGRWVS